MQEHRTIVREFIKEFRGREIDTAGDGFVVKFTSTLDAVRCALQIQKRFQERNAGLPRERAIRLRIGIHVSDVIESEVDAKSGVYGDGVNIAARLQPLATKGGICISGAVYEQIAGRVEGSIHALGTPPLKGINRQIRLYTIELKSPSLLKRTNRMARSKMSAATAAIAAVLCAIATGFHFTMPFAKKDMRVAVLPLDTVGLSREEAFLSDGLVNAVISTLSRSGVHVLEKDSAVALKKSHSSPLEIGKTLQIDRLVRGELIKNGDTLKVQISLIDTQTQEVLWSEDFQKPTAEILELKNLLASRLLSRFHASRSPTSVAPLEETVSEAKKQAYVPYLRGQFLLARRTKESLIGATAEFEKAIALDPEFAPAYAELAITWSLQNWYGVKPPVEGAVKVVQYASKALELNPNLTEALLIMAEQKVYLEQDFQKGEEFYKRALTSNPRHALTHQWYAEFLAYRGRFDESFREVDKAVELDPLSTISTIAKGTMRYFAHNYDSAINSYKKAIEMDPTFMIAYYWLGRALIQKKDYTQAINVLQRAVELSGAEPMIVAELSCAYAAAGDVANLKILRQQLEAMTTSRYVSPYFFAKIEAALGHTQTAKDLIQHALVEHDGQSVAALVDPELDALRPTRGFEDAIKPLTTKK